MIKHSYDWNHFFQIMKLKGHFKDNENANDLNEFKMKNKSTLVPKEFEFERNCKIFQEQLGKSGFDSYLIETEIKKIK